MPPPPRGSRLSPPRDLPWPKKDRISKRPRPNTCKMGGRRKSRMDKARRGPCGQTERQTGREVQEEQAPTGAARGQVSTDTEPGPKAQPEKAQTGQTEQPQNREREKAQTGQAVAPETRQGGQIQSGQAPRMGDRAGR